MMDAAEIAVVIGGIVAALFVLWYFFGEKERTVAEQREGATSPIRQTDRDRPDLP